MRITVNITEQGKTALDKIAAFNPDKSKIAIVSELLVEAAKGYKGRKPKPKAKEPVKTVKKGR